MRRGVPAQLTGPEVGGDAVFELRHHFGGLSNYICDPPNTLSYSSNVTASIFIESAFYSMPTPLSNRSTPRVSQTSSHRHSQLKVRLHSQFQRSSQLKLLTMLSMIRAYKQEYEFRRERGELPPKESKQRQSEDQVYGSFVELETIIRGKMESLKKENGVLSHFRSATFTGIPGLKTPESTMSTFHRTSGSQNWGSRVSKIDDPRLHFQQKCKQEVKFFRKLNSSIETPQGKNLASKALHNLSVLKDNMMSLKFNIFRHYKLLDGLEAEGEERVSNIVFYCSSAVMVLRGLRIQLQGLVDTTPKYKQLRERTERLESESEGKSGVRSKLQVLLLYFVCLVELKHFFQNHPYHPYIELEKSHCLRAVIEQVIQLRHFCGYLHKQIINLSLPLKQQQSKKQAQTQQGLWRTIFGKKYLTRHTKLKTAPHQ